MSYPDVDGCREGKTAFCSREKTHTHLGWQRAQCTGRRWLGSLPSFSKWKGKSPHFWQGWKTDPLGGVSGSQGEGQGQKNETTGLKGMLQPRIEGRLTGEGEKDGVGTMMPDSLHPYTRMRLSGHYLEWGRVGMAGN